jgi:hypothetical protein
LIQLSCVNLNKINKINMIKDLLNKRLSNSSKRKLKNFSKDLRAIFSRRNLNKLGEIYGTDKVGVHFYTPHYMTHLKRFRLKKINLLEIGVGGYENPLNGGNSLRMWKKYFPFGRIFSLDIYDKSPHQENRIKIFKGSQVDKEFLNEVSDYIGGIDIIIDDGSHINEHVIETFNVLFPKLTDGGIYIIEDSQTSYWEDFGGDSKDLKNSKTIMNYFKSLTDSLNNQEFVIPNYRQSYYDKKIISMHFYHNLIFIYKGNNDEKSNLVVNNKR